ncbi:MAG: exo-alpha-sialidase [Planctomycetaceae bacterium]|nr:exo-alpha-sialidase [Planctomycetaceae bacterium]
MAISSVASAESPVFHEQLIFPLQDKHVHSSSIVELPNDDLLCCWFHGSGERSSPDVMIHGSRLKKGSAAWSPMFPMADTADFPDLNPVLFVDQNEQLWMFWITVLAERWDFSMLRYKTSTDYLSDGPPKWLWQDHLYFKPGDKFAEVIEQGYASPIVTAVAPDRDYGSLVRSGESQLIEASKDLRKRQIGWMPRTHAMILPSGRILLPLYSDGYYVGLMAISDDQGKTWWASSPIVGVGLNQPTIVRKQDGTIVAYMREEGEVKHRVLRSESKDDGETWSVADWTDIPNPNTSLEVIALRDGLWVMIYNDIEDGRDSLALAVSEDEGDSWTLKHHLEQLAGGKFHYPSIIQTRDGIIHATYTHQPGSNAQKSIKHVSFNSAWLKKGD